MRARSSAPMQRHSTFGFKKQDRHTYFKVQKACACLSKPQIRQDWDMQPDISFGMVSTAPTTTVPEPASFALFGVGLAGLVMMKRRSVA